MNTYIVNLSITATIDAPNKYVALDQIIQLLQSDNVNVNYYDDIDNIDDHVSDLNDLI